MERATSVDDLLGGFFRSVHAGATGIGRTDSEAAFQEFLKRIPSTTNLAAAAGQLDGQAQALLQGATTGSGAGAAGATAAGGILGSSNGAPSSTVPMVPSLTTAPLSTLSTDTVGAGIPRVPSLDFYRQLMGNQPAIPPPTSAGPVKLEVPPPVSLPPLTMDSVAKPIPLGPGALPLPGAGPFPGLAGVSTAPLAGMAGLSALTPTDLASISAVGTNLSAALSAVPGFNSAAAAGLPGNPLAAAALTNPAAAAAAALQLGQLGQLGRLTTNNGALPDKESMEKAEVRRARRMLSNRESARRSRRRKQEHLSKLESEVHVVVEEKRSLQDIATSAERKAQALEEENKRLREENERLRDELKFLRTEITERKDRNGYYRREQESDEEQQPLKRHRESRAAAAAAAAGKDATDKKENS